MCVSVCVCACVCVCVCVRARVFDTWYHSESIFNITYFLHILNKKLLCRIQQQEHKTNVQNMSKANNKDTRTKSMASFRGIHCKTQTNCHSPLQRPHCWLPTSKKEMFTRQRVRLTRVKSCILSFVLYFDLLNLQVIKVLIELDFL